MGYKTMTIGQEKRIALVAHDNKKRDLLEWAKFNRDLLAKHRLYATGTTGNILEEALRLGAIAVDLKIDSELLVRQLQGTYRSKKMKQHYEQIRRLLGEFESYSVEHIPREKNKQADALSKKAIRRAGA